jgi:heme/copper-type cytochrome/quinol oxidase subunit 4
MKFGRLLLGRTETVSGTVYGTIVVLSMLAAGAATYEQDPWQLVAIMVSGTVVLWAAHVYSHGLGESVRARRQMAAHEVTAIARMEASILLAAVLPVAAVTLGAAGVLSESFALWLALGLGVAALTVQALRYSHLEQMSRVGTAIAVAVNLGFGLVFVALKALLAH